MGSHWRARVGQFQLKKVRSPNLFLAMCRPAASDAAVFHDELAAFAGGGGGIERDGEAVGGVLKRERRAVAGDSGDGHALAVFEAGQVEHDLSDARLQEAQVDGGLARHFVVGVGESDAEGVVLGIDGGLARVVIGDERRDA